MRVEAKLAELGLVFPGPMKVPPGFRLPFAKVRIRGKHAYVAGRHALDPDGSLAPPFGKVGAEVTPEQAYRAARLAALAMLSDLKRELGDLDRVSAWLRVLPKRRKETARIGTPTSQITSVGLPRMPSMAKFGE